jgi:methionine aminotransferase
MSKLPKTGTSIFTTMSKMAADHNAINLAQGFPNFAVDPRLTEIVSRTAQQSFHQYMPSAGYPPLLDKIAKLTAAAYQRNVSAQSELLVTAGATQAIFTAIQAFVRVGEEVIILDPAYDCYDAPVLLSNATPVHVALADDFSPDWNAISEAMNERTRMIIINNPHNPSGKIWTSDDFAQLESLLSAYPDVIVLSDEVYEFITFEQRHISVNTREKLRERSIVVSSFGKSFHITGWKIGYAIAAEHLMAELKKVHQFLVFSVNSIAQAALSEYLDVVDVTALRTFYQDKRDRFRNLIGETRFTLLPCEGSYFQLASYSGISSESDIEFTKRLASEFGVAAIPLSAFYENGRDSRLIRFCFAKDDDTLREAATRLEKL